MLYAQYTVYTLGKEYTWMIGLGYTVYSGYKETTAMIYAYVYKEKGVRIDDACKMKTACAMHIVMYILVQCVYRYWYRVILQYSTPLLTQDANPNHHILNISQEEMFMIV